MRQKMIIDSRIHKNTNFRPFTVIGAIAYAVSTLNKDENIVIDSILDYNGEQVTIEKIRMGIHKVQKELGIKCVTRIKNEKLIIFRIE